MASESPMPTANDQEVIDPVTQRGQMIVAVLIVGVVFMLGVSIVLDPFGSAQRRGGKVDKSNYLRLGKRAAGEQRRPGRDDSANRGLGASPFV
jgi:hypothetical protein